MGKRAGTKPRVECITKIFHPFQIVYRFSISIFIVVITYLDTSINLNMYNKKCEF
jgi:hypothetical protein